MKLSKNLFLLLIITLVISGVSIAKVQSGMNMSSPSIQHLKQLNDMGAEVRKNDVPIEKPDVSGDTSRVKSERQKYYDQRRTSFPSIYGSADTDAVLSPENAPKD